jgi:hypothetical protein
MEKKEIIYLASKFADKGWDYETCMYCDDLYGQEDEIEEIWEYVIECKDIGRTAFYIKYSEYKLY